MSPSVRPDLPRYRLVVACAMGLSFLASCRTEEGRPSPKMPIDTSLPGLPTMVDRKVVRSDLQNGFSFRLDRCTEELPPMMDFYDSVFGARGLSPIEAEFLHRPDLAGPGVVELRHWKVPGSRTEFLLSVDRMADGTCQGNLLLDLPLTVESARIERLQAESADDDLRLMETRVGAWDGGSGKQARLIVDLLTDDPVHSMTSLLRWDDGDIEYLGQDGRLVEPRDPQAATLWADVLERHLVGRGGRDIPVSQRNTFTSGDIEKVAYLRKGDRWEGFQGLRSHAARIANADPVTAEYLRTHPQEIGVVDSAAEAMERLAEAVLSGR